MERLVFLKNRVVHVISFQSRVRTQCYQKRPRIRKTTHHLLLGECVSPWPSVTQLTAHTAQTRALPRQRASPFSRSPDSPPLPLEAPSWCLYLPARLEADVSCVQVLSAELAGRYPGRKAASTGKQLKAGTAAQSIENSPGVPARVSLPRQADGLAARVGCWICHRATRILLDQLRDYGFRQGRPCLRHLWTWECPTTENSGAG